MIVYVQDGLRGSTEEGGGLRVKIGCGSQKDWREREKKGYVKGVHVSRKTQGCVGGKKGGPKGWKESGEA